MWYIYTKEYCSAIKRNETVPFAEMWIDVQIVKQSEKREKHILYIITYMWNLEK